MYEYMSIQELLYQYKGMAFFGDGVGTILSISTLRQHKHGYVDA